MEVFSRRTPLPPAGLLSCCSRRRRGGEVSEETGVIERGQREGGQTRGIRRHTHCEWTSSGVPDTLPDLVD